MKIIIGERFRKDLGDIEKLAESIADVGLLQPICVDALGNLIDGVRRLKAWEQLGRSEETIERFTVNLQDILKGEYVANTERKDFLPSEAVAIKRAVDAENKRAARERQEEGRDNPRNESGQFTHPAETAASDGGEARVKTAAVVGMGHTKLYQAEQVVKAAEDDPERFGSIVEEMDRTGNVNKAYTQIAAPEIPAPVYGGTMILVAPTTGISPAFKKKFTVALAHREDIHVYLWVNNRYLEDAMNLYSDTGIRYRACLTWCMRGIFHSKQSKDFVDDVRFALLGIKGNAPDVQSPGQSWHFDDKEDFKGSNMPASFYDVVRTISPPIINQENSNGS